MEKRASPSSLLLIAALAMASFPPLLEAVSLSKANFADNFNIMWSEDHFKTSEDGQIWYLSLDKETGCGFQTKERYRFGWFSMKLKLLGGDSAGVVTAYYFNPTEDFHSYSILWNNEQLLFFVDEVPIRVYKNNGKPNNFFPNEKPMYLFSSIWNADDWATRGGLEKTDWKKALFVSSYKDFNVDGCQWEDPYPACVSTTTENRWDQYPAWHLSETQKLDFAWVKRNLVIYDYCEDTKRYPTPLEECSLSPWD
ncbi:hypothetical protein Nepgr_021206 [Nepenthes gracilis]|uniref:Xyloglucan endotransglucosylase/hydrolase n=1 Tax=Nepenthes gracilis TaxID=150966 RepID=A0AAD3XX06_NEPGR|nr:hypothetical protein Nepgr_021206 [Nepenthes gracilis]